MTKRNTIRKEILAKRAALSGGEIEAISLTASHHFLASKLYQNANHIGFFMAQNGEIDPSHIMSQAIEEGKSCYLPTLDPITDNSLVFVHYNKGESLVRNRYNILEPVIKPFNVIGAGLLDVVLVPLVGIDNHGNRLGMGKGYYDRTFEFKNNAEGPILPTLVGFGYEFQKHPVLDQKSWDVPMDYLVTEKAIYQFRKTAETA